MAALTYYLLNSLASGSNHYVLQEGGSAPTFARITTGWEVATVAPTVYSRMDAGIERLSTTLTSTPQPDGVPDNTLGDGWRSANRITGDFASGNWTFNFEVEGSTRPTSTTDGRLRIRMWRSVNANMASATEITGSTQVTSSFTNIASTVAQLLTLTFNPGAVSLALAEYLFIQVALEVTGAGDAATADVHLCNGPNNSIVTPNFVLVAYPTLIPSGEIVYSPALALNLLPSLVASASTVYSPTIALNLLPSLVASAETVYSPTVSVGAVTLTPSLVASAATVYSPTLTTGPVTLSPSLVASVAIVRSPTITVGAATVAPSLVASVAQVFSPIVSVAGGPITVVPALVASSALVYSPTIAAGAVTLAPALVASVATVYSPALRFVIAPALVASIEQVFSPTLLQPGLQEIQPALVISTAQVFVALVMAMVTTYGGERILRARAHSRIYSVAARPNTLTIPAKSQALPVEV